MSAKLRILSALRDGPKATAYLCDPGVGGERFGARVAELRALGYEIETEILRPGSALYTLNETSTPSVEGTTLTPAPASSLPGAGAGVRVLVCDTRGRISRGRKPRWYYDTRTPAQLGLEMAAAA